MADKGTLPQAHQIRDLINQLAVIIKTAQVYDLTNSTVQNALARMAELINDFVFSHDVLAIDLVGDYFYVNETRARYSTQHMVNFDYLVDQFKAHDLGTLTVEGRVIVEDLATFLRAFILSTGSKDPFRMLSDGLSSVEALRIGPFRVAKDRDADDLDMRKQVKRTYFNAVSYIKGVMNQMKTGEKTGMKRAKRIIESVVDRMLDDENLLLGMTAIKDYDEYTYHHSVNVSILAIALGQRLGLTKAELRELGLVALFHDIGKIEVPPEILNKPSELTDDEWEIMRRHPFWGLETILKLKRLDRSSIRAAITAVEHHITIGLGGYPRVSPTHEIDIYSRIVMIADRYDAMTSARVYSRTAMAPEKALQLIAKDAGITVDPLLTKIFVRMIGLFPIGTLVLLDTGELGLVSGGHGLSADRPSVMLIADQGRNKLEGTRIDLTEKDEEGRFLRSIVKTADPAAYGISLAEFLL
jgi:HD-GYP domain-containing protein (c-di-GMP phosphodiesterase class II)